MLPTYSYARIHKRLVYRQDRSLDQLPGAWGGGGAGFAAETGPAGEPEPGDA